MPSPFDDMTLDEIAAQAQKYTNADAQVINLKAEDNEGLAAFWLQVLQAKAALEAAELQRQGIEDQTDESRKLVRGTRWLAGATIVLALATIALVIVTLYVRPEVVVEVTRP